MAIGADQAIERLEAGDAELDVLLGPLSSTQIVRSGVLGDGGWSVKDLIGHIASWEHRALSVMDAWSRHGPFEPLIGIRAVHDLNERNLVEARSRTLASVRRDAHVTHRALIQRIAGLTPADLRSLVTLSTGRRHRLGTLLGSTTAGPEGPYRHVSAHLPDVRAYVASLRGPRPI